MTDQAQSERAIFLGALEQTPGEQREAYVHQACRDQPALLRRVQKLLSALEQSAGPLDFPPPGLVAPANGDGHPAEGPGTQIGPYKLLEQIGEGGFGVVFMAEQTEPIRRKVALKVLKAGMDTRQVIARFEAERQALALMDHPNIARVLEAGATQSGRPFFVMELVRGIPITDYCDQAQVKPTERLDLFLSVCRAVQHAHQKGIIHRDLKPSNVLVTLHDGAPVVKVIDFGIAKAVGQHLTEKTLFTNYAQMMGTPMYMSPEQAALSGLDIDTRSDVYSLGVLLYELVTGTTPVAKERLANADFDEMRRIIREEEPPPPSTRISTLQPAATAASAAWQFSPRRRTQLFRGELDWVVMKCLSKDRTQRYESASALAADVERYLQGQPIEARPPSAVYRFRKYVRRHGIALTTIGLVTAALLIGIAASTWQAYRATQAKRKAEENYQKARQAVDRYFTIVSQGDLLDEPGLQPLRKELLEAALDYYLQFLAERAGDAELKVELAATHVRAGNVCHLIDRNDDAIAHLKSGLQLISELLDDPRNAAAIEQQLAGVYKTGRTLHLGTRPPSDPQDALRTLQRGAEIWKRLASEHPQALGFQSDLGGFYRLIGDLQRSLGRRRDAIQTYQAATQLLENLVRQDPRAADYRAELASCHEILGLLSNVAGETAEAERSFRRSEELRQGLVAEFPEKPEYRLELASAYRDLAVEVLVDQPTLAQENLQKARELLRRLVEDHPGIPVYEEQLARVQMELAERYWQAGEASKAEAASRQALDIFEQLVKRFPKSLHYRERLLEVYRDIHPLLVQSGREDEARLAYQRVIALQASLAADLPDRASYHERLAWLVVTCPYTEMRDAALAVRSAKRAVDLKPTDGNYWRTLGAAYYRAAAHDSDSAGWQLAIEALDKSLEQRPGPKGYNQLLLAMALWQLTDPESGDQTLTPETRAQHRERASQLYKQAVEWIENNRSDGAATQQLRTEAEQLLGVQKAGNPQARPDNQPKQATNSTD